MDQSKIKAAYVSPKAMRLSISEAQGDCDPGSSATTSGCKEGAAAGGSSTSGCDGGAYVSGGEGVLSDCTDGAMASQGSCSVGAVPLGQFN